MEVNFTNPIAVSISYTLNLIFFTLFVYSRVSGKKSLSLTPASTNAPSSQASNQERRSTVDSREAVHTIAYFLGEIHREMTAINSTSPASGQATAQQTSAQHAPASSTPHHPNEAQQQHGGNSAGEQQPQGTQHGHGPPTPVPEIAETVPNTPASSLGKRKALRRSASPEVGGSPTGLGQSERQESSGSVMSPATTDTGSSSLRDSH